MPVKKILREASDLKTNPVGGPGWNTIRVDPSTDTLVFGTGASGTTEKTVSDTTSTLTLTNKTLTAPVLSGTVTGTYTLGGTPTITAPTIATSVGALSVGGSVTSNDATTPSFILPASKTNTGTVVINGKTSGSLTVSTADATAQAVTVTAAAQTSGGSILTIPDQVGVNRNFVFDTATQTLTNKTFSAAIESDAKVLAAAATFTSNATLASLSGFSWTLSAGGTYVFVFEGPVTMTTNGGLSVAFKLTTATLTSLAVEAIQTTASAIAVAAVYTTTSDQSKFIDQKTTAYTYVRVSGSLVVNAAGSIALQAAQNTSHVDTTTIVQGFIGRMTRVL